MKTLLSILLALICSILFVVTLTFNFVSDNNIEQSIKKHKKIEEVTVKTYKYYSDEDQLQGQDGMITPQELSKQIFISQLLLRENININSNKKTTSVSVTSGNKSGKGVYFDTDKVITCYHIYDSNSNNIAVNGYPATILEYDEIEDYMILETLLDTENYVRDYNASEVYVIQDNIVKGDSGVPVFDTNNRLYGIILGKRSDGKIEVLDTRKIIKNFYISGAYKIEVEE